MILLVKDTTQISEQKVIARGLKNEHDVLTHIFDYLCNQTTYDANWDELWRKAKLLYHGDNETMSEVYIVIPKGVDENFDANESFDEDNYCMNFSFGDDREFYIVK